MPISIRALAPSQAVRHFRDNVDDEDDEMQIDDGHEIVTPGEVVTDDPQWMRWVTFS